MSDPDRGVASGVGADVSVEGGVGVEAGVRVGVDVGVGGESVGAGVVSGISGAAGVSDGCGVAGAFEGRLDPEGWPVAEHPLITSAIRRATVVTRVDVMA